MGQQATGAPQWPSRRKLEEKFRQHRRGFSAHPLFGPLYDADDYDRSARDAVQDGVRFSYTDSRAGKPRVGYFDPPTGRFTEVTADDRWILTHYPTDEDYVRDLPDSGYP